MSEQGAEKRGKLRVAVAASIALCVLLWGVWSVIDGDRQIGMPMQVVRDPVEPAGSASARVAADVGDGRSPAATGARLKVESNETGQPIEGALVAIARTKAATFSASGLDAIGATDARGEIGFGLDRSSLVVARMDGFIPAGVEIDNGQTRTLRLARGNSLTVSVTSSAGDPVEGACVVCYGAGADARLVSGSAAAAFEVSLFAAESNGVSGVAGADGKALLRVPSGTYSVVAYADGKFMVEPPRSVTLTEGEGAEHVVSLAPLLGCIVVAPGSKASSLGIASERLVGEGWEQSSSLLAGRVAHAETQRLQAANPGALCRVLACVAGTDATPSPSLHVRFLVSGVGWVEEKIPLLPLSSLGAHHIDPRRGTDALGGLELRYDGDVAPAVLEGLLSLQFVTERGAIPLSVPLNEAVEVPVGEYFLESGTGVLLAKAVVTAGKSAKIRVDDESLGAVVTLNVSVGGNASPWGIRIVAEPVEGDGGGGHDLSPLDPGAFTLLMAPGEYRFSGRWLGRELPAKKVRIAPGRQSVPLAWSR